jgi:hypothetical protein
MTNFHKQMNNAMSENPKMTCPSCGGSISPGAAFCGKCGKKLAGNAAKGHPAPPIPEDTKKSNPTMKVVVLIVILLAGFFAYQFIDNLPGGAHPVIAKQPVLDASFIPAGAHYDMAVVEAAVDGDHVTIPISVVEEKKIVAFEYAGETSTVPLLAFVSSEGKLVTAFRICELCNSKEYSIDGDRMSCGRCDTQWSLRNLDGLKGNCQKYPPDPLPSTIRDGLVVISIKDILGWNTRL